MVRNILSAGALALALAAAPALAQMPTADTGTMTAADVGVSPMEGVSATDYVKFAADGDNYEIQSSRLALRRAQRDDVKAFANQMITDHTQTTKSLMASLSNADRKIARPPTTLSADSSANLKLLQKAPKGSFDNLYLTQQVAAHQKAWALHKGYATTGTDTALKQVAATAVPVVEQHLAHVKGMVPAAMSTN